MAEKRLHDVLRKMRRDEQDSVEYHKQIDDLMDTEP